MNNRVIFIALLFFIFLIPINLHAWTQWYTQYGSGYVPALMYIDPAGNPQYPQSQWAPPAKTQPIPGMFFRLVGSVLELEEHGPASCRGLMVTIR